MPSAASIFAICVLAATAGAFSIDNRIMGRPQVNCEDTTVSISFKTEKPFNGRVYARGLSNDYRCSRNFDFNKNATEFSMIVRRGDCNMQAKQKSREDGDGHTLSMVIVVSFHSTFVTKVDRAYHCICSFASEEKQVSSKVVVGGMNPTELMRSVPLPMCVYELHAGSPDGPQVAFAKVGDPIVHVWKCGNSRSRLLVHSCMGTDGRGKTFFFYDRSGCAIDPIIMPDIEYDADGSRAYVSTWGFKFSDQNIVNFDCAVESCNSGTDECDGFVTPPKCGHSTKLSNADGYGDRNRNRRSRAHLPLKQPLDYMKGPDISTSVLILDDFNSAEMSLAEEQMRMRGRNSTALEVQSLNWDMNTDGIFARGAAGDMVCLSHLAHSALLGVIALLFATSFSLVAVVCTKKNKEDS